MQKANDGQTLFSASDLTNFLECAHRTTLDQLDLETPMPKARDDENSRLVQAKGLEHEDRFLESLRASGLVIEDLSKVSGPPKAKAARTLAALRAGPDVLYQATLLEPPFVGHPDFLIKAPDDRHPSGYCYEVLDTKLAHRSRAKFLIQLCAYSELLGNAQGRRPVHSYIVLGTGEKKDYRLANLFSYYRRVKDDFLAQLAEPLRTVPEPCNFCDLCHWRERCRQQWLDDDHLSQVAGISKLQIKRLREHGVKTMEALGRLPEEVKIPRMASHTLAKLHRQALLQLYRRVTGKTLFHLYSQAPVVRGFARLPLPNEGDLFFDMEGDPHEEGGLEYLFGVYYIEQGKPNFRAFWAHTREGEKHAFGDFIDFVVERLRRHPKLHIYHYAHYEPTALKHLMSLHGTREAEVDELLRRQKLVDLYKVVREGMQTSEPGYSIKDMEVFYQGKREGTVTNAGASVVAYEHWKATRDPAILESIRAYNEEDCRSTHLLREWLLSLRPAGLPWFDGEPDPDRAEQDRGEIHEHERRLADYREKLMAGAPKQPEHWRIEHDLNQLVFFLLDFHRRAAKPQWWGVISRMDSSEEELIEDPECIGGLYFDAAHPPEPVKRSHIYTYLFPEQDFKLKEGDQVCRSEDLLPLKIESLDEESRRLTIKTKHRLNEKMSLSPGKPLKTKVLQEALFRFADSIISGDHRYPALEDFLARKAPRILGHNPGTPIIDRTRSLLPEATTAVSNLDHSTLFIQGPPGAGKTYTGSHLILSLIRQGHTVGVASNSHKAINNLLRAVEERAREASVSFVGVKKSSANELETHFNGEFIEDVFSADDIPLQGVDLLAGTAFLFARLDQHLDYLFVDEAGQVSVANLVAMGQSARNVVLLGDQMQLGQPIQGVHPGRSGESTLDYLLNGAATIAPDRGIFLDTTWRMHPDVCRFISEAVYEGRLNPESQNRNQTLILNRDAQPELRPTGIRFIQVRHEGNGQKSQEEADTVVTLYRSLLSQHYQDRNRQNHPIGPENVLVVAPYNMQVNLLKRVLPEGARVGTVDKFQGQEAEVVIISLATSNGEYLPRSMDFLFSKNRLNVALSRARCLALLVASPDLLRVKCHTPEQMTLVNLLCWISKNSCGEQP